MEDINVPKFVLEDTQYLRIAKPIVAVRVKYALIGVY